jgi:hypothetical protein
MKETPHRWAVGIGQRPSGIVSHRPDQGRFHVASVAFGEVFVLAQQHDRIGPEIARRISAEGRQPAATHLGFANLTKPPPRLGLVSADQDINPTPLNLRKCIPDAPQLIAAEGNGLDGGHGGLGNLHAIRVTIQPEDID